MFIFINEEQKLKIKAGDGLAHRAPVQRALGG
jgi:hypothetical protein